MDYKDIPKKLPRHPWDSRRKAKKVKEGVEGDGKTTDTEDKAEL
jgi:hypothetical protein